MTKAEYSRNYRRANPDKFKAYKAKRDPEKARAYNQAYYQNNKIKFLGYALKKRKTTAPRVALTVEEKKLSCKASDARWRAKDPERTAKLQRERQKRYQAKHPERRKSIAAAYWQKIAGPDSLERRARVLAKKKLDRVKNKDRIAAYQKEWHKKNPQYASKRAAVDIDFKLINNYRHRVWTFLKGAGKSARTKELLGCSLPELRQHLEKQFLPGMTWTNYGQWHVDHIIPCNSFRPITEESLHRCFHFTNLQPLWGLDNISKGCKVSAVKS